MEQSGEGQRRLAIAKATGRGGMQLASGTLKQCGQQSGDSAVEQLQHSELCKPNEVAKSGKRRVAREE